jgi:hypothetical protein
MFSILAVLAGHAVSKKNKKEEDIILHAIPDNDVNFFVDNQELLESFGDSGSAAHSCTMSI